MKVGELPSTSAPGELGTVRPRLRSAARGSARNDGAVLSAGFWGCRLKQCCAGLLPPVS